MRIPPQPDRQCGPGARRQPNVEMRCVNRVRLATRRHVRRVVFTVSAHLHRHSPVMELARPFLHPSWPMNVRSSLVVVTRGNHYLTPSDQPWLEEFMRRSSSP